MLHNAPSRSAEDTRPQVLVRSGDKVAFLGASITEAGWQNPSGYLRLVARALAENGVDIEPIPAGVGGHTSRDMLARLENDVLERQPRWMTLDAGRNDVWHGTVSFREFMANMAAIVGRAQESGIGVLLQTITPIGEDLGSDLNARLAYCNDFVRHLAAEKDCPLTDLNADFARALEHKRGGELLLTTDGTHMNARGDRLMAVGLLRTLGLSAEQIARSLAADREL